MDRYKNRSDSNIITRKYFDSILLEMRHIDAVIPDTKLKLFGECFDTPVMMAALSHLDSVHSGGMEEMAKGAYAANAVMWAGMGDEDELKRITSTGAKTIKIIKPYADKSVILNRIRFAESVGCIAVGMDVDHAFGHTGQYDIVLGLKMIRQSLDDIKEYVQATSLPFIIKGVLSVQDALKCLEAGVQGIVVSHHHGIMDYAVPPLMILPEIVSHVKGKMKIFLDCGVESGMDVFKALALGADAVSVGRAIMQPLSEHGAGGVCDTVKRITEQLAGAMARTCSPDIYSIDKSVIRHPLSF